MQTWAIMFAVVAIITYFFGYQLPTGDFAEDIQAGFWIFACLSALCFILGCWKKPTKNPIMKE